MKEKEGGGRRKGVGGGGGKGECVARMGEEREREREGERDDLINSFLTRIMKKHTSAFLCSALAQRGTKLLRIHTANAILHTLKTCMLSNKAIQKKKEGKKKKKEKRRNAKHRDR